MTKRDPSAESGQIIEVPGDWLSIDFHVHSPASHDFQGPDFSHSPNREQELYQWLISEAHAEKLDIIVITDHNDIRGYQKLQQLKTDIETTIRTLQTNGSPLPENIIKTSQMFDELVILPGVELDTNLGVHYLVIFDPESSFEEYDSFIERAGFPISQRGKETTALNTQWSPQDVCRESSLIGAITIAAHVDSTSGIYEATKKLAGHVRITAFCDENLYGMEFIKPTSRDQIGNILNLPDYVRPNRLAFVQSSDFHGRPDQKIGQRKSWVRMDGISRKPGEVFAALKKALRNPDEYLSAPERPALKEILRRLGERKLPAFKSLQAQQDIDLFLQYVSAFANTQGGSIVVGKTEHDNWVGFDGTTKREAVESIRNLLKQNLEPSPAAQIEAYDYYGQKFIATVRVRQQNRICSISNRDVFTIVDNKPVQADVRQIVQLSEELFIQRYQPLAITNRLHEVAYKLSSFYDSLDVLPIIQKIEAPSVSIRHIFESVKRSSRVSMEVLREVDFCLPHGNHFGNIIIVENNPPRADEHYVRITPPRGAMDHDTVTYKALEKFSGEKLIIVPGGAVYYDSNDSVAVLTTSSPRPLVALCRESGLPVLYVALYLKSSVALWYAERRLNSADLFAEEILTRMQIPRLSPDGMQQIVQRGMSLIELESAFLERFGDFVREIPTKEWPTFSMKQGRINTRSFDANLKKLTPFVEKHNKEANAIVRQIDEIIYDDLHLSVDEIEIINTGLEAMDFASLAPESNELPTDGRRSDRKS